MSRYWPMIVALGLLASTASGTASASPGEAEPKRVMADTNSPVRQLGPGHYQVGLVQLRKETRTITLPATVNQTAGPVEYVLVSTAGKLHESLLRTETEPYHIHLAMLLLDAKGASKARLMNDRTQVIPGDPVTITLTWTNGTTAMSAHPGKWVANTATGAALADGPWTYSGSRLIEGTFIAQRDRSVIALKHDVDSLLNHPVTSLKNENDWRANSNAMPPLDTPIQITIRLNKP